MPVQPRSLAIIIAAGLAAAPALAQPAGQLITRQCVGSINGVPSQSTIQFEVLHGTTPFAKVYIAGEIQNPYASYSFKGELNNNTEGFVSLLETRTNERIDRVYIGLMQSGYALRPLGANDAYAFACQ